MENEKRIATSNAEMVTISRAEYESQQTQLTELKLQNQWLLEQLGLAKKRQFGSSSEKLQEGLMDQLSLSFNELEAYAYGTKSATPEQVAVKAHARKKQSGSVTEIVPEGTPTEVVEHRLSEEELICSACGSKMEEIGKEVRRSLQMEPARFWIREDVYYTYACRKCEQDSGEANILKTPKEPALLPGSYASAEAVAHIAVQKFVMYSPLYRLEQEFHRQGLKLSRQTMSNWLLNVSDTWLQPIYEVLHRQLCREKVLHGDETTLQVLKEPGKAATSKSYMWLYRTSGCTEHPIVLYEYQQTRNASHPREFLKGYDGICVTDGYQVYHTLEKELEELTIAGCWVHCRRRFDEALKLIPKPSQKESNAFLLMKQIQAIYREEGKLNDLSSDERLKQRQAVIKPLVDAFFAYLKTINVSKKDKFGDAVRYARNQEKYLRVFLTDGDVPIDNNASERAIRGFCIGKKNWQMIDTIHGAKSSAIIYSIVETAKANNLKPFDYVQYLLEEIPKHMNDKDCSFLEDLLPWSEKLPAGIRKA